MQQSALVIEKGIPVPPKKRPARSPITIAFRAMVKGDSVLIPDALAKSASVTASKELGKGCHTHRKESGGVRYWRTK